MIEQTLISPASLLAEPYFAYSYSYPHKSAYGPLDPVVNLQELWQQESRDSLFLYIHLPFCEMRCGFCNLFARAGADHDMLDGYLAALDRQARVLSHATRGKRTISRLAIGGGTPTFLETPQLAKLFHILQTHFDVDPVAIPTSMETSPKTATYDRLAMLRERGVSRISIGVQSFVEAEVHSIGRPQANDELHASLERIRDLSFPILNIDLIYGQPLQSLTTWLHSVHTALQYRPEEIFLYPLYVRAETGLARRGQSNSRATDFYQDCYQAARAELLQAGYEQMSMRYFRRIGSFAEAGPSYCCQSDGMLGLGCGARSYTSQLHYSAPFAVASAGVQTILNRWMQQTEAEFSQANWGIRLNREERQRRFVIQSLLHRDGLDEQRFSNLFGAAPEIAIPEIQLLLELSLVYRQAEILRLTERGIALSDAVGPALYSSGARTALLRFTQE
jgi:oxygen-independent coproporphyrinogen III oxidase